LLETSEGAVVKKTIDHFQERVQELTHLKSVLQLLSWDQETTMPSAGAAARAAQIATLSALHHEKLTDPAFGGMLGQLENDSPDPLQAANLREARRQHEKAARLPSTLVRELAETTVLAYEVWVKARRHSDFPSFSPWLDRIIRLKREEALCLNPSGRLYDALLDDYEPGMTVGELDPLFSELRPALTGLTSAIQASPSLADAELFVGDFPVQAQREFGKKILAAMGFDWESGRLDRSPHPFCIGISPRDVRITTRYSTRDFTSSLFGIIHEGGHALYEQGLNPDAYGMPVCEAVSLGMHESQSRLWENQVARSLPFWEHWYPELRNTFPGRLDHLSLHQFVRAINRVEPSLIRVEADEVTYGLHVILRYELEKRLIQGDMEAAGLEESWNLMMKEYLGITPGNAAEGVLQDTHWSHGLIGYFPTYVLGNLYGAQIFARAQEAIPDLEERIRSGDLLTLRKWLREELQVHGKTYSAKELLIRVSGTELQTGHFIGYLHRKFSQLISPPRH
jgi:carboxypeptidase Taq